MDSLMIGLIVAAIVIFFMAGREIVLWYSKINVRIKLHEDTNKLLQQQVIELSNLSKILMKNMKVEEKIDK